MFSCEFVHWGLKFRVSGLHKTQELHRFRGANVDQNGQRIIKASKVRFFCLTTDGGREAWCFCLLIVGEKLHGSQIIYNFYIKFIYGGYICAIKRLDHSFSYRLKNEGYKDRKC